MPEDLNPDDGIRDLPFKTIGILLATILATGVGYLYLEPTVRAWLWTVRHHSTAPIRISV